MTRPLTALALLLALAGFAAGALAQGGALGVQLQTMNPDMRRAMGLQHQHGVLVNGVVPGSAAERAGVLAGDVLLELSGERFWAAEQVAHLVGQRNAGEQVYLLVWRQGAVTPVRVQLGQGQDVAVAPPPAAAGGGLAAQAPLPQANSYNPPAQPPASIAPTADPLASQSAAAPSGMLSGPDIARAIPGRSRRGQLDDGTFYCEYYDPNGQIRGRDVEYYTGMWSVSGDFLCYDYAGSEYDNCERLFHDAGQIVAYDSGGNNVGSSVLLAGNACGT